MKTTERTKSYLFPVVLEPDGDSWRACVRELENKGASTWGRSRDEALKNIQEVMQMVIEEMIEDGEALPRSVKVFDGPVVAITV
jgi:predicted RNase H-like HicB family nuclease